MRTAPSADALLTAWEQALSQPAALGAMALLDVARPDLDPPGRGALSVGARNTALLELRTAVLGTSMQARAGCPACGASLELELPSHELGRGGDGVENGPFELEHGGWRLRYRLLHAEDLADLAREARATSADPGADLDVAVAQARLVARCLLEVTPPPDDRLRPDPSTDSSTGSSRSRRDVLSGTDAVAALPEGVVAALAAELTRRDPHAEVLLALSCPACGHRWETDLDVPAFVSDELQGWARRLLHEVHLLASAYGWSEAEILRLSPTRRRAYLELVLDGPAGAVGGG